MRLFRQLVLLFSILSLPVLQAQTETGNTKVDTGDAVGRAANDRMFNSNFADFANLASDPNLTEQVELFAFFVTALDISIGSVTGSLDDKLSIRDFKGSRNGKEFLSIGQIAIEWDISEIALGRLSIKRLLMDQVKIEAGWAGQAAEGLEFEGSEGTELPPAFKIFGFEMPRLPISIDVGNLLIRNLKLSEELVGQDVALDIGGRLLMPAGQQPIDTKLEIVRRDSVRGAARAQLRWQPDKSHLTMILAAEENERGLLQKRLNLDEKRSYQMYLEGAGPIRDWSSKIVFSLSDLIKIDGNLKLSTSETAQSARIAGMATFLDDAKNQYPRLAAEPVELDMQVGYKLGDLFRIENLLVKSKLLDVSGNGWIDPESNETKFLANLQTKDGNALKDILPDVDLENINAELGLERSGNEARLGIKAKGTEIGWASYRFYQPDIELVLDDLTQTEGWLNAFNLDLGGAASSFEDLNNKRLKLENRADFSVEAKIDTDSRKRWRINKGLMDLQSKNLSVGGSLSGPVPLSETRKKAGGWTPALRNALSIDLDFNVEPKVIKRFTDVKTGLLSGEVSLKRGKLSANVNPQHLNVEDPTIKALLGTSPQLRVTQNKDSKVFGFETLTKGGFVSGTAKPLKTGYEVKATSKRFDLRTIPALKTSLEQGHAAINLAGTLSQKTTDLQFEASSVDLGLTNARLKTAVPLGTSVRLSGDLSRNAGQATFIRNMDLSSTNISMQGDLAIPVSGNMILTGTATGRDINQLLGQASGVSSARLDAKFVATGRGQNWRIKLESEAGGLINAVPGQAALLSRLLSTSDSISLDLRLDQGKASLEDLSLSGQKTKLNLVQAGNGLYVGSADLSAFKDLAPNASAYLDGLGGKVSFNLTGDAAKSLRGTLSTKLEPRGQLNNRTQILVGAEITAELNWQKDKGTKVRNLRAEKSDSSLTADFDLNAENKLSTANIKTDGLQIADLSPLFQGHKAEAKARGTIDYQADKVKGDTLQLNLTFEAAKFQGKTAEKTQAQAEQAQLIATLGAPNNLFLTRGQFAGKISAKNAGFFGYKSSDTRLSLSGKPTKFHFDLASQGKQPIVTKGVFGFKLKQNKQNKEGLDFQSFDARIEKISTRLEPFGVLNKAPIYIRQTAKTRFVKADDLRLGGAKLSGQVIIDAKNVDGVVKVSSPDIGWLSGLKSIGKAQGSLEASIDIKGTPENPTASGSFRANAIEVGRVRGEDDLVGDLPVLFGRGTLGLAGQKVWLNGQINGPRRLAANADLSFPVRANFKTFNFGIDKTADLSGNIQGNMGVEEIAEYLALEGDELDGEMRFNTTVGGTVEKPDLRGDFSWENGRYENEATGLLLENLNLVGTAQGDTLVFGSKDTKDLDVKGRIDLKPKLNFPISMEIQSQRANLIAREDANLLMSSFLRLNGALLDKLQLVGNVRIDEAEVRMPNIRGANIVQLDVIEINKPVSLQKQEFKPTKDTNIDTAIRVFSADNLNFRGAGVNSRWSIDMNMRGPINDPSLTGAVVSNSGGMTLLGKRFKLTRGEISYNNQSTEDPRLDLLMERADEALLVQLVVDGTLQKPEVEIRSVPELPTDQIVSQLLFNEDPGQLNGVQAVELVTALTRLQNFGQSEDFVERLRLLTGLDSLTLAATDGNDTALRAGKNINRNAEVWVEQGLSATSARIGGEYRFLPNLKLESDYGLDQEGKVELDWSFEY